MLRNVHVTVSLHRQQKEEEEEEKKKWLVSSLRGRKIIDNKQRRIIGGSHSYTFLILRKLARSLVAIVVVNTVL